MTRHLRDSPENVKYLRATMATVSKRLGKVKAIPIINEILGEDPLTGKIALPADLTEREAMDRATKLQAVLDRESDSTVIPFKPPYDAGNGAIEPDGAAVEAIPPGVKPEPTDAERRAYEESLVFADYEADDSKLLSLQVVAQFRGKRPQSVREVYNRFVWCTGIERWIDRAEPWTQWKSAQFDSEFNIFLPDRASLSKQLFKGDRIKRFKRVAFVPGQPEFYGEVYNLWRPSLIVPKEGDTSLWDQHLRFLFPKEDDRNRLLDWLAWVYQNQAAKPNHALLIVGETMGTGKSFVTRVMEHLIGLENTQRPKNSSLGGDFNGWVVNCKLAIIEELMNVVSRKEVEAALRDLITEPRIEVNIKGIPAFPVDSYMAMIGVSNHTDAMRLQEGDRRWLVVETPVTLAQKREKEAEGYYGRLMPMVDKDNPDTDTLAAIAYQLKTRKLGKYDARGEAPMTDAKATMIELGKVPLVAWLDSERQNDPFTRRVVNIRDDIVPLMPPHIAREQSSRSVEMTIAKWIKKKLNGVPLGDAWVGGRTVKLWGINGTRVAPSLAGSMYSADKGRARKAEQLEAQRSARDDFGEAAGLTDPNVGRAGERPNQQTLRPCALATDFYTA